ncbi:unnamed protein product [Protopolystoma xenopodis]|uniref:Uncharacterized protein n=1 Tax=Protopolystoma xenopodis TaxID=117903 RepID=A0A3S5AB51_9PLAT|nr:unnamed protein product [Protopolystoma xenopodis]
MAVFCPGQAKQPSNLSCWLSERAPIEIVTVPLVRQSEMQDAGASYDIEAGCPINRHAQTPHPYMIAFEK